MAATAYASLVSLMHIIDQIMDHGRNSFSLKHEQVQSLREKAAFLVDFLERYSHGDSEEVEALEGRIADASHAAEDLIETKVVNYIHQNQSTSFDRTRSNPLCQRLHKVIQDMERKKKEAKKIKEKLEVKVQLLLGSSRSSLIIPSFSRITNNIIQRLKKGIKVMDLVIQRKKELKVEVPKDSMPSSSSLFVGKYVMVGFDDVSERIMNRLTRGESGRLIIPISGMGGIGKTTLARNVYENPIIAQHFEIHAWVTISQDYQIKEILMNLLCEFGVISKEASQGLNEIRLGERLHKHLLGRSYLIVMDDMWSSKAWDIIQLSLPNNKGGCAIMITTRQSTMASYLGSQGVEVNFLNEDQSWELLWEKVFAKKTCSLQLEDIGKKIAINCKGLPLSIVVIAGLLRSHMTEEYWESVAKQVSSFVSLADYERCSKILSLSYKNLPVHLKPCFLYMGVFSEDLEIKVSRLIKLWVAEGFLKPKKDKSLEDVAEEYLIDLIQRNLIMVHKHGSIGKIKICKIHDLLGELCLNEAKKEKFICVIKEGMDGDNHRRVVIDGDNEKQKPIFASYNEPKKPKCLHRSITFNTELSSSYLGGTLIRVLNGPHAGLSKIVFDLLNLRYLNYNCSMSRGKPFFKFPSKIYLLWNLQTLIIQGVEMATTAPPEIWEMKQLRHIYMDEVYLPEPPPLDETIGDGNEDSNLKHLQTLLRVRNMTCSEAVVKRIPNIKKLQIFYDDFSGDADDKEKYCLNNIQDLLKLESFNICFGDYWCPDETHLLRSLILPKSIQKLSLVRSRIPWEQMTIIGSLPNLQVLKLKENAFIGTEWYPIEEQFISLKFLLIEWCVDLKIWDWDVDSQRFPVLEKLLLHHMTNLEEIPLGLVEIQTLQLIQLVQCSDSAVNSTIDILAEQENQGTDDIHVRVMLHEETQLKNMEVIKNFKFITIGL